MYNNYKQIDIKGMVMEVQLNAPINETRKEMRRIEQDVALISQEISRQPSAIGVENELPQQVVESTQTENLVRLKENEILYSANAKVLQTADNMMGMIIDLRV